MRRVLFCFILLGILFAFDVSAQDPGLIPPSGKLFGPGVVCDFTLGEFDFDCIPIYIGYLVQVIFTFSGGFALIEILKGGYQIGISGLPGQDKEAGKRRVTWALIGLALSILAFVVVDFVISSLLLGP